MRDACSVVGISRREQLRQRGLLVADMAQPSIQDGLGQLLDEKRYAVGVRDNPVDQASWVEFVRR